MHLLLVKSNKTIEANRTIYRKMFSWNIHHDTLKKSWAYAWLDCQIGQKWWAGNGHFLKSGWIDIFLVKITWFKRAFHALPAGNPVKRLAVPVIATGNYSGRNWKSILGFQPPGQYLWFAYFNSKLRKAIWIRPQSILMHFFK